MSSLIAEMEEQLKLALSPSILKIRDDSASHKNHPGANNGGHFKVYIVASAFTDKSPLERHRMIYAALGNLMQKGIHALSIQAKAHSSAEQSRS